MARADSDWTAALAASSAKGSWSPACTRPDRPPQRPAWRMLTDRDAAFLTLVQTAVLAEQQEIRLGTSDIEALTTATTVTRSCPSGPRSASACGRPRRATSTREGSRCGSPPRPALRRAWPAGSRTCCLAKRPAASRRKDLSLTSYAEHPGQYGEGAAMAAAEEVFAADTLAAIAQVTAARTARIADILNGNGSPLGRAARQRLRDGRPGTRPVPPADPAVQRASAARSPPTRDG